MEGDEPDALGHLRDAHVLSSGERVYTSLGTFIPGLCGGSSGDPFERRRYRSGRQLSTTLAGCGGSRTTVVTTKN